MKNDEMKINELLKQKSQIGLDIFHTEQVLKSLRGELADNSNFPSEGKVRITTYSSAFDFKIKREFMVVAAEAQLKKQKDELEPIAKKLEAIELLLNASI